ncbi:hypothetical protein B5K03_23075 [Rhizobium phaseoli]|nr:hypothetical protein B5K03_23075 [Rhizobium phaseoli]
MARLRKNPPDEGKTNKSRTDSGETGLAIAARRGLDAFQRPSLDRLASPDRRKSIENECSTAPIVPVQERY